MSGEDESALRRFRDGYRWERVEHLPYKEDGRALFKDVSRQVLFSLPELKGELRYFEVAPGGYSTLERHEHVHAVLVLRGSGRALVGREVMQLGINDLVTVPALTWHQFRAAEGEPLGFLCLVDALRDRPQVPGQSELDELMRDEQVRLFLAGEGAAADE